MAMFPGAEIQPDKDEYRDFFEYYVILFCRLKISGKLIFQNATLVSIFLWRKKIYK